MDQRLVSGSRLERVLRSGRFAVTAELNPPDSADPQAVYERALVLSTVCDAINATDASGANCHMSSVGICALLTRAGYEPVYQISCRDRNRIAIQGDLLGAAAMGVKNVLCLTGDDVQAGDQPEARPVFDFDSMTLLRTVRIMRDQGKFLSGRQLDAPPRVFLWARPRTRSRRPSIFGRTGWPRRSWRAPSSSRPNIASTSPRLQTFMAQVRDLGLDQKVFILVGVGPLRSAQDRRLDAEQRAGGVDPR